MFSIQRPKMLLRRTDTLFDGVVRSLFAVESVVRPLSGPLG